MEDNKRRHVRGEVPKSVQTPVWYGKVPWYEKKVGPYERGRGRPLAETTSDLRTQKVLSIRL